MKVAARSCSSRIALYPIISSHPLLPLLLIPTALLLSASMHLRESHRLSKRSFRFPSQARGVFLDKPLLIQRILLLRRDGAEARLCVGTSLDGELRDWSAVDWICNWRRKKMYYRDGEGVVLLFFRLL